MYNHVLYLSYWFVNAIVLFIFNKIFPGSVVLGNFKFSSLEAAIYAGFWVTVIFWIMWDYVYVRGIKLGNLSGRFLVFWSFNFVSYWLVSRFPDIAGFGISSFLWALGIGVVAHLLQRFMWILVVGKSLGRRDEFALQ